MIQLELCPSQALKPGDQVLFLYSDYNIALAIAAALHGTVSASVTCMMPDDIEQELRGDGLGWLLSLDTFIKR